MWRRSILALGCVYWSLVWSLMAHAATSAEAITNVRESLWEVFINGQSIGDFVRILADPQGRLLIASSLLESTNLDLAALETTQRGGERLAFLDSIPGVSIERDASTQTLQLQVPPGAFSRQRFDLGAKAKISTDRVLPGAFFNYDLSLAKGAAPANLSGLFEFAVFGQQGLLTHRMVARDLTGDHQAYRLDTQFTRDYTEQVASLTIGDTISAPSAWSRSINYGGVQWRTKFAARPDLQTIPLPVLGGVAASPSVVDIYVDNILRARQPVGTGPFELNSLPIFTGQGTVQLVVRDVLGRQQLISENYITSAQLLKPGLRDVAFEGGWQRLGYGTPDSSYRAPFAAVSWREGLSQSTIELHGEADGRRRAVGAGLAAPLADVLLASAGAAVSAAAAGAGKLAYLQLDSHGNRTGAALKAQFADRRFTALGYDDLDRAPLRQIQAQINRTLQSNLSVALGYIGQRKPDQPSVQAVTANLSYALTQKQFLSIGLVRALGNDAATTANVNLVLALDNYATSQLTALHQPGMLSLSADYVRTPTGDQGWGYHLRQAVIDQRATDIGASYLGDRGQIAINAAHQEQGYSLLAQARGGIALLGGMAFATRYLDDSFAVVEVPIDTPVDIYANNRKVGQTNENGVGLIPRLTPYVRNRVYLDDANLPMDMTLDLGERDIVPPARGGLWLKFDATIHNGVTLILRTADRQPLPPGTAVRWRGDTQVATVGLRGEVFMPDVAPSWLIDADLADGPCSAQVPPPDKRRTLPKIGPLDCRRAGE